MKPCLLLIIFVISVWVSTRAQYFIEKNPARFLAGSSPSAEITPAPGLSTPTPVDGDLLTSAFSVATCYDQKIKMPGSKGAVFLTAGDCAGYLRSGGRARAFNGSQFTKAIFQRLRYNYSRPRRTIARLVMMMQGIPYLINLSKNKNIAVLKFTCQKASFGASAKACKKATGITFSIPLAVN